MTAAQAPIDPRISIALCTFNGERYLAEQVGSILTGSALPGELVISDDGSADGTLAIVEDLCGRAVAAGISTTVLRNSGLGVTANFETAIRATSGAIVVLADQDDVWESNRLAAAIATLDGDPQVLLQHSDALLIDAEGASIGGLFDVLGITPETVLRLAGDRAFEVLLRRNLVTGATVAFRRDLLEVALPFPARWLHDEWLAIVAAAIGRLHPDRRPLIRYRQHGSNQVGAARVGLRARMSRVLGAEGGRTAGLAARSGELAERLRGIGADPDRLAAIEAKARFEDDRSRLPRIRLARVPAILRLARQGGYVSYASQGLLDVFRDLLQDRRAR